MDVLRLIKNSNFFRNEKFNIGMVVLWVGTRCTLRCKGCGNMIPYADQKDYDINKAIENIKYLMKYCHIEKVQIQGGSHSYTKI